MSAKNLGIILFSGLLIFTMAPVAPAAQSYPQEKNTMQKSDTQKGTVSKEASQSTASDKNAATKTQNNGKKATMAKAKPASSHSSDEIREVQLALKNAGFDPGPIDGGMGPRTAKALRAFQYDNGILATGKIDDESRLTLGVHTAVVKQAREESRANEANLNAAPRNEAQRNEANLNDSEQADLNPVSDRADVREIQLALDGLQYNPGSINGMMTSDTRQAIREFQMLNGLPVTGNADNQTRLAIEAQAHGESYNVQLSDQRPDYTAGLRREKPSAGLESEQTQVRTETRTETKTDTKSTAKIDKDGAERAQKAAEVLLDLTGAADKKIPTEMLERAQAIAVIPHVVKGAFGIGGRYGKGLVSQRLSSGRWSPPAYLQIGGGSFGAQIGVSATDLVLVFTDAKGLDLLAGGKDLKLGVDASIAAGPVGRSAEAGVNANLETGVLAYSRSKGLFAGVALDGAVLDMDGDTNRKVYGESVDGKQILNGNASMNPTVRPFMDALEKVMPKKRMSQR